jgi:hypothetical protein
MAPFKSRRLGVINKYVISVGMSSSDAGQGSRMHGLLQIHRGCTVVTGDYALLKVTELLSRFTFISLFILFPPRALNVSKASHTFIYSSFYRVIQKCI